MVISLDRFKPYEDVVMKPIAFCTHCDEPITADQEYVTQDGDPFCDKDCFCDHMDVRRVGA